jgi:hypothetical protein
MAKLSLGKHTLPAGTLCVNNIIILQYTHLMHFTVYVNSLYFGLKMVF